MALKILEFKGPDFLKGVSIHPSVALGGLFQVFGGCNPFEQGGLALPSYLPQVIGSGAVDAAKSLLSFNNAGNVYLYQHGDISLNQFLATSPYTFTSETAQINQYTPTGGVTLQKLLGTIIWQNSYIYTTLWGTNHIVVKSTALPVASGNDVNRADLVISGSTVGEYVPHCVGPGRQSIPRKQQCYL